ncbi:MULTISPECIES: hypothetical protein [unclassified Streptomyces]|uniref:hypothetical protein n=1 Tax=unclassified Streptomyces TaxID=2593676 RepID=UPI001661E402|nr:MULTISPECIES: hypothetical protein [unclassified Streptomyces]MBD0844045.1 hypothetical protein [Streptomyces sp. TRM68416]
MRHSPGPPSRRATADVPNSTTGGPGAAPAERAPAQENIPGHDRDVFEREPALRSGGDQPAFRLVSQQDAAWTGGHFVAVDAQQ